MVEFAKHEPRSAGSPRAEAPGLVVRVARLDDAPSLGAISARREGKDPLEQTRVFSALIAEVDGRIAGFGKVHAFRHPSNSPANAAPEGWYLSGVVVDPEHRRQGIGHALTAERLRWIAERASGAYYFATARNLVTIDLHRAFGFVEVTRDFWFPGASFTGGVGILFRADLHPGRPPFRQ